MDIDIKRSLLQQLREETNAAHQTIEKHPLMLAVLSEKFSLTQYKHLLSCFFSFYQPLELKIKNLILQYQIEYTYHPKCHLLEKDLLHLNYNMVEDHTKQLSTSFLYDQASLLGVLYVIEGSTLGGTLIRKTIAQYINVDLSAHFFYPYGKHTQIEWKRTCDFIQSYAQKEQLDFQNVCKAANHTFHSISESIFI